MHTHAFEIMKEYIFPTTELDHIVKGRISKSLNPDSTQPYTWEISHRWRKSNAQGFYYPSSVSATSFDEARTLLFLYAKGFSDPGVIVSSDTHY